MRFRITPTKNEKTFIKMNRTTLQPMLSHWIWEMKSDILAMSSETQEERNERDRAISSMEFIESLLKTITIVITEPKESKDSGI